MDTNLSKNIGSSLASRIEKQLDAATNSALTSSDRTLRSVRAGWQQRYGALHTEDIVENNYLMFGSVWNSSFTAGP